VLRLCAAGRHPTEIAAFLLCSRSSVYRIVRAYRAGSLGLRIDPDGPLSIAVASTLVMPWLTRALSALLKKAPRASGWGRTRWSCAPRAATLRTKHGSAVSADTLRRWLHELGWVWQRAKVVAKDDAPHRSERVARSRLHHANLQAPEVRVCADALARPRLPQVGAAWMRQGAPDESMTPGTHEQPSLAGALHLATGKVLPCRGPRQNPGVCRDLLPRLDTTYAAPDVTRLSVVGDHSRLHKANAVPQWLPNHPRFVVLWLPTSCPRANPMERVFGEVHDKCTRNHKRKRLGDLIQDVERHMEAPGPWQ
jgi:transposase